MPTLKKVVTALMLGLMLVPATTWATVKADSVVSLTWDGTYQTDLSQVPGAPDFIDWSKNVVPYARLQFTASSACSDFDGAELNVWEPQYQGGMTYYVSKSGTTKTETAVNASTTWEQYVHAGAAYLFSGYSRCDGAEVFTWDSDMYYSEVVEVPPVIARVRLKSSQTQRYFNRLKAGETFQLDVDEYTPRDFSSATYTPRVFLVVEGAGLERKEYDITERGQSSIAEVKPTQEGTLALRLKVQNYLYYRDCFHNVADSWDDYDWEHKQPAPDYAATLVSSDRLCDHEREGVKCPRFGQPIFRAVPYTLESTAAVEIPVEDAWCLVQDRADSSNYVVADEGCHSCSATYNANAAWWEDACAPADPDEPDPKPGSLGCSAAGPGSALAWLGLALVPALRRRRGR